jgi:RimJ/RimL family protein N-acetyltransferase
LLVPERVLIVGRIDKTIASSIQLIKPAPSKKTRSFSGKVDHHFVAPWARGHGLAKLLLQKTEDQALENGISFLRFNVRDGLDAAIKLYESCGYQRWGTLDQYEKINGKMIAGHYYCKDLSA